MGANVDPLGLRMRARVFPEAFPILGLVTALVVPGVLSYRQILVTAGAGQAAAVVG